MSSPHPIFDVCGPREVRLCLTTQYQPRVAPGGCWLDCSPWDADAYLFANSCVTPNGANLDGASYMTVPSGPLLSSSGDWTVVAWANQTNQAGSRVFFSQRPNGTSKGRMILGISDGKIYAQIQAASQQITLGASCTANKWNFLSWRRAGSSIRIGVFSNFTNGDFYYATAQVPNALFGAVPSAGPWDNVTINLFVGRADDLIVCNCALLDAQIRYLYESTRHRFGV